MTIKTGLIILIIGLIGICCQEMPSKPENANPLDPDNPLTGGDPFELTASLANGGVTLDWAQVTIETITGYKIHRSIDDSLDFHPLAETDETSLTWLDTAVTNGHSYRYKVSALSEDGEESGITNITGVRINTKPVVVINGGADVTSAKDVQLTILAATAKQIWLSHTPDFSDGTWEPYTTLKSWVLLPGSGLKTVYFKAQYADGTESLTASARITPLPMNPSFILAKGSPFTTSRDVPIHCEAQGAHLMMMFSEDQTFSGVSWQAFQDSIIFRLSATQAKKTVYAKFKNDFEIESSRLFQEISPQPISDATLNINENAKYATNRLVNLRISASGASLMKISEDSLFSTGSWVNFKSASKFQLSTTEGEKFVHLKVKNDFEFESPVFSNSIILDLTPPTPLFTVSPDSGIAHETHFFFNASACKDNLASSQELEIRWDWENDNQYNTDWTTSKNTSYFFKQGGERMVKLQIRDAAGWTNETTQPVFVNSRPVAQFLVTPTFGENTTLFQCDAGASADPDGESILLRWDFQSDGIWDTGWSTTKTTTFQYSVGGNYQITLQVKDSQQLSKSIVKPVIVLYPSPMDYVPAGEYTLGNAAGDGDDDENPAHTVQTDAFSIDRYEVTNAQYSQFLVLGNREHYHPKMKIVEPADGFFLPETGYEFHPVVYVTYDNAMAYAKWRQKNIPTEAQWEIAARSSEERKYPWGDGLEINNLNYWNSGDPFENLIYPPTTPVGYYNGETRDGYQTRGSHGPFGTYDLAGNAAEWCRDWYQPDYYRLHIPTNPTGPATGSYRVIRGGSWADAPYHVRATARSHHQPTEPSPYIGFRCVK